MIIVRIQDILWGIFLLWVFCHRYIPMDVSSLWKYALVGLIFFLVRSGSVPIRKGMTLAMLCWGLCEVIVVLLQEWHWISSNHQWFETTGTFGNPGPLGGFLGILCAGVIDSIRRQQQKGIKILPLVAVGGLLLYGMVTSGSRAGLLAALTGVAVGFFQRVISFVQNGYKKRAVIECMLLFILVCIGSVFLYRLRPFSANGRLLVWFNTLRLMAEHPFVGWGSGGWTGNYMLYQADFLATHPNSQFVQLADNVAYPYNEWLRIGVEHGLFGLILFVWIIVENLKIRQYDWLSGSLKTSLWAFLIFSLFSYPFDVIQLLVLWAFLVGMAKSRPVIQLLVSTHIRRLAFFIVAIILSILSIHLYGLYWKTWHDYELFPYFQYNPDIMYMYAQKKLEDSDSIHKSELLEQTAQLCPNSQTYCWLGDDLMKRGKYREAKFFYQKATDMVPTKITSHYKLFKLYLAEGDTVSALSMGRKVLTLKLKVESIRNLKMRGEIKRFLQEYDE